MEKSEFKELKERLLSTKKNGYDRLSEADRAAMEDYCAGYKRFLDVSKTERLCAALQEKACGRLTVWYCRRRGFGRLPFWKIFVWGKRTLPERK